MVQNAGRPISTAMRLLLREPRLLTLPRKQRLSTLLADSRKFQNEVSEKLAEQVLHALYELLRGFQAAHDASGGELLRKPLAEQPDEVYRALLTVILRLVFVLFAEERDMLPTEDGTFSRYYSIAGLHERLRDHAAHFPDTMDQRYGAWAQLLVLFRMIHDGATAGDMTLPARHGVLFDPDRFPFLEARIGAGSRQIHERIEPPLVPDGTVYRALDKLLVLDGERISYRALDVEQIGSVYETMMGFRLETATGRSLAIKAAKKMGAPTAVDLDALLAEDASKRGKWIQDRADRKLPPRSPLRSRMPRPSRTCTAHCCRWSTRPPHRTCSHRARWRCSPARSDGAPARTTPRARSPSRSCGQRSRPCSRALRGDAGQSPRPEAILELKVCDPAMGSGAFLVETCRQLGDALIEAWNAHGGRPEIPPDEDEVVFARRLVAQRCLYGVDRNPVAVDLAKMSLWLATLAREHALTFVDHALRHGDSLVGLSRRQIQAFHWDDKAPPLAPVRITQHLERVGELRAADPQRRRRRERLGAAGHVGRGAGGAREVRLFGDLVVLAYFSGAKASSARRSGWSSRTWSPTGVRTISRAGGGTPRGRAAARPVSLGDRVPGSVRAERRRGSTRSSVTRRSLAEELDRGANGNGYPDWLCSPSRVSGNADLVAHFFRRALDLLRPGGTLGLIATNTIAQGDTRSTGLRWICTHGGEIYAARRRVKWPGAAAVIVSVVHIAREPFRGPATRRARGGHDHRVPLPPRRPRRPGAAGRERRQELPREHRPGHGVHVRRHRHEGRRDTACRDGATDRERPANAEVIFPYIGGEEVNTSPTHAHHRYVINFGELTRRSAGSGGRTDGDRRGEGEADRSLEGREEVSEDRDEWWQYAESTTRASGGDRRTRSRPRNLTRQHALAFAFLPAGMVYSQKPRRLPLPTMPRSAPSSRVPTRSGRDSSLRR